MSYFRPPFLNYEYTSIWNREISPQQLGIKWPKKGYLSNNGYVTMCRPLSQGCKQCKPHNHMDSTFLGYQAWLLPSLSLNVRLSEDDLLQKCLHGKRQNQNRSLTEMVEVIHWNQDCMRQSLISKLAQLLLLSFFMALDIPPYKYT